MGMAQYSESCKFIREEFKLDNDTNIYDLVTTITDAYRELKETSKQAEQPLKKEKKRGRPRKQSSSN